MLETRHDLQSHFPQDAEILSKLKADDPDFRHLAERYTVLDKEIHRIEAEEAAIADDRLEEMKKQRLDILDDVAARIAAAR